MMTPARYRYLGIATAAGLLLFLSGCVSPLRETRAQFDKRVEKDRAKSAEAFKSSLNATGAPRQLSIQDLDQLAYGYADRYYMVISSAVDALKRSDIDPGQRRFAHQIKLTGVQSINDIVSGNDPYSQIFDLVVSVTLQSIVLIDENGAEKTFGEYAAGLIKAMRMMRVEAWDLAAKVLKQDQLEMLDYVILEWRRTHPDVDQVAFVRFDNFAGSRGKALLSDLKAGGGFLAPISEASQVLKDWNRLTERAFWYTKRAPNIAAIQAEGAVNEILATPEIDSMLRTADRLGKSSENLPQTIEAQRKAFFAEVDARQTLLTNTLGDLRSIVANANSLGGGLNVLATNLQSTLVTMDETFRIADTVGRNFGLDKASTNASGHPFDIRDYIVAVNRLNDAISNAHQLALTADQISQSEHWGKNLQNMTAAADRRIDRLLIGIALLLGFAFALAVIFRVIVIKQNRPPATHPLPGK